MEERTAACEFFNDPASDCSILLTTYMCGAYGLNMQAACNMVVMLESAPNVSTTKQAAGRVHRPGQLRPQKVLILFQDHTIQRWMEWNNIEKFIPKVVRCLPAKLVANTKVKAQVVVLAGKNRK
ncbi:hypothetical protein BJX63DRAFT_438779 [Aspergillus granulosus]|uniref:Helicase C-terminal domain-containing protein n=1 Tax=Aspergillus granulosus TaxID=176169 RepID=A0ABR4GRL5_9EURO